MSATSDDVRRSRNHPLVTKDAKGEWRWRLKASNGKIIADSGEGYKNEADCKAAIEHVKRSRDAPLVEIKST